MPLFKLSLDVDPGTYSYVYRLYHNSHLTSFQLWPICVTSNTSVNLTASKACLKELAFSKRDIPIGRRVKTNKQKLEISDYVYNAPSFYFELRNSFVRNR